MTKENGPERVTNISLPEYYWPTMESLTDILVDGKLREEVHFLGIPVDGRRYTWIDETSILRSVIKYDKPRSIAPNFPSFQFIKINTDGSPYLSGEKYFFFPVDQNVWRVESQLPAEGLSDEQLDEIAQEEYESMATGQANANDLQSLQLLLELNTALNYPEYTGEY